MQKLWEVKNIQVHKVEIWYVEVQLSIKLSIYIPIIAQLVH